MYIYVYIYVIYICTFICLHVYMYVYAHTHTHMLHVIYNHNYYQKQAGLRTALGGCGTAGATSGYGQLPEYYCYYYYY